MMYALMALFVGVIVALDQWTKVLTLSNIALYEKVPFLDGLFHFTYVQNTGAAFSSFEGMHWLFALVFLTLTAGVVWEFSGKRLPFTTLERWCVAAIWAGGLGNIIDRLRLGYVVDMIETEFMAFPVFNVADCFITCGCFALIISLFFNREFWKEETK